MTDIVDELAKVLVTINRGLQDVPHDQRDIAKAVLDSGLVVSKADYDEALRRRDAVYELAEHRGKSIDGLIAQLDEARAALDRWRQLFTGGPDTPCRTTWTEGVEHVEVPMSELRAIEGGEPDAT